MPPNRFVARIVVSYDIDKGTAAGGYTVCEQFTSGREWAARLVLSLS